MNTSKRYCMCIIISSSIVLLLFGMINILVDPCFHYHKPINGLNYPIRMERYQNDGIVRHFEYDAIITGTSMCENFKTSEADELFEVSSVKVAAAGSFLREGTELINQSYNTNHSLKLVIRSLDQYALVVDPDTWAEYDYPYYLYDANLMNDISYILNKDVFLDYTCKVLKNTIKGVATTNFDEYANWSDQYTYGRNAVLDSCTQKEEIVSYSDVEIDEELLSRNLEENIISMVREHPETEFYFFFPPYSIVAWDSYKRENNIEEVLEIQKYTIEAILPYENAHIFSFYQNYDMICNLDNYKDYEHYSEDVNSLILQWMYAGEYELTEDNYKTYLDEIRVFYENYDYGSI